jgi:hypothetical protein
LLEAVHGDPGEALILFEAAIDSLHRAGDIGDLAVTFADMSVLFDRLECPEIAATFCGVSRRHGDIGWVTHLPAAVDHLRAVLGDSRFDDCLGVGAAMEITDAVAYAREQIQAARRQIDGAA